MDNNVVDFNSNKKHRFKKKSIQDQVEQNTFIAKTGAMVFGVSALVIAAVNIEAAYNGLPLDSVSNLITDGLCLLSGGAGLKATLDGIKEMGSLALNSNNDDITKSR